MVLRAVSLAIAAVVVSASARSDEPTRALSAGELQGIWIWNEGFSVTQTSGSQVTFEWTTSLKNTTKLEIKEVTLQMTSTFAGKKVKSDSRLTLTHFSNRCIPLEGPLLPWDKCTPKGGLKFNIPSSAWRSDSRLSLEVVAAKAYSNPQLNTVSHFYSKLIQSSPAEQLKTVKANPGVIKLVDPKFKTSATLVAFAAADAKVLEYILGHGGSAKDATTAGATIAHMAAMNHNTNSWPFALKVGANPNQLSTGTRRSPLEKAITRGMPLSVKFLLEHKANPNHVNKVGESLLAVALQEGVPEVFNHLIKAGADPKVKDQLGRSLWHLAAFNQDLFPTVKATKLPMNQRDKNGDSPVNYAILIGRTQAAAWLIQNGCDYKVKNNKGQDAKAIAKTKHPAIYNVLPMLR